MAIRTRLTGISCIIAGLSGAEYAMPKSDNPEYAFHGTLWQKEVQFYERYGGNVNVLEVKANGITKIFTDYENNLSVDSLRIVYPDETSKTYSADCFKGDIQKEFDDYLVQIKNAKASQ